MNEEERKLLLSLKDESSPARAAVRLFDHIVEQYEPPKESPKSWAGVFFEPTSLDVGTRTYALLSAFNEVFDYDLTKHERSLEDWLEGRMGDQLKMSTLDWVKIRRMDALKDAAKLDAADLSSQFVEILGDATALRVPDNQLVAIQKLINELRDAVSSATFLGDDHRQRLLSRLEKFQQELHKPIGDLDRFFGIVVELGSVLGKFGERAKPMLDRVRELGDITVRLHRQLWGLDDSAQVEMLTGEQEPQLQLPPGDEGANEGG